jgi:DNA polymerase III alpha subunit
MKLSKYGQVILNTDDVFDGMYSGKITDLETIFLDNPQECNKFNESVKKNHDNLGLCKVFLETNATQEEFDSANQKQWFMPEEYQLYDIVDWLYCECKTTEEKNRVTEELKLYAQHNMITLLKYLKYLVDTMRKNNIVWGVGRGSSVASYCLYLIGVHKVDSIKYDLDIHEFLKGESNANI